MVSPCRHTFSGLVAVALLGAALAIGSVSGAPAEAKPQAAFAAADSCPGSWPELSLGPPGGRHDGAVSVFSGGNLYVIGGAGGAEGSVVALGDASFARETPGTFEVGVTTAGSQITPYPGSDMLAVGGNLTGDPGTHIDVGQGIGGDVAVAGTVADGTDIATHGGNVDTGVADATTPFAGLPDTIATKSAQYAALPTTGTAEVTETAVTLSGDGVSGTQVFTIDAATLAPADPSDPAAPGRTLQLLGVPAGATVVVNLTGPSVDFSVETLLTPEGLPIDVAVDPYFSNLTTHLLWNVPTAENVHLGGPAQLPGSLLVAARPSVTLLTGGGTNGRILAAGDLVLAGAGQHSYPFLPDADLGCEGDRPAFGSLTLDLRVVDPDQVVPASQVFHGTYRCDLEGENVTPADNSWQTPAGAGPKVLSDHLPAGAVCTVTQELDAAPSAMHEWVDPVTAPDEVTVVKRRERGFVISDGVRELPPVVPPPASPTVTTPSAPETEAPPTEEPTPELTPSALPEPTNVAHPVQQPPVATPAPTAATADPGTSTREPPRAAVPQPQAGPAGPLTTTAPFTLRGTFVWGPTLMLSVLTLMLRIRRRPKRERLH